MDTVIDKRSVLRLSSFVVSYADMNKSRNGVAIMISSVHTKQIDALVDKSKIFGISFLLE